MALVCVVKPTGEKICSPDGDPIRKPHHPKPHHHHHAPEPDRSKGYHVSIWYSKSENSKHEKEDPPESPCDDDQIVGVLEDRARRRQWTEWDVTEDGNVVSHHAG